MKICKYLKVTYNVVTKIDRTVSQPMCLGTLVSHSVVFEWAVEVEQKYV